MIRHHRLCALRAPFARGLALPLLLLALLVPAASACAAVSAQQPLAASVEKPWRSVEDDASRHALVSDRGWAASTIVTRRKLLKTVGVLASAGLPPPVAPRPCALGFHHILAFEPAFVSPGRAPCPYRSQGPPRQRA